MSTATASKPIMSNKDILTDSVIFVSLNYRANPKKKGQHYPPFEIVPTMDEIYEVEESDGGNKQNERTRLIRYAPGIPSIYAPDDYDVSTHKAPPILLQDGYLAVSRKEVKLIEYLTKSNYNLNNINRMPNTYPIFKIRDEAQTASDFIQQEMEEVNLKMIVNNMSAEELEAYAMVLGDTNAPNRKTDEIKRDLLLLAKHDPKKFKSGLTDKKLKRKVHIMRAFQSEIFSFNKSTREITWKGGKSLAAVPFGQDEHDFIVNLSFNKDFEEAYQYVLNQLYPNGDQGFIPKPVDVSLPPSEKGRVEAEQELSDKAMEELRLRAQISENERLTAEAKAKEAQALASAGEVTTPKPVKESVIPEPSDDKPVELKTIDRAIELGIVTKSQNLWHRYGDVKLGQGHRRVLKNLQARPELYKRILKEVEAREK